MDNPKAGHKSFKSKPWLGLKRIAPFQTEHNAVGKHIRIFWLRLLGWVLACLIIFWFGITGGAYFFVKYGREYTTVHYSHLFLFPWKIDDYRRAKCEFLLVKGKAEIAEQKYIDAFNDIRLGLLEVPQDTEARINIVQFYIALKRYDLAEQTLAEGLKYNTENLEYVMTYFRFLFSQQWDDRVVEFSRKLQLTGIQNPSVQHALIMAEASAHYFRGRYGKARSVLQNKNKLGTRDGKVLFAEIIWHGGQIDKALALLAEVSAGRVFDDEVYNIRLDLLRQLGRLTDVRSLAVLHQLEQSDEPRGFIDELSTFDPDKDAVRWAGMVSDFFSRFPSHEVALNGLAELAAKTGQVELAWRVYRQCKATQVPWLASAKSVIEAHIAAKRYAEAIAAIQSIMTENTEWAKGNGTQFDIFRSIANYTLGDKSLSALQLQNYLNDKQADPANFVAVAEQMARVGALDQARTILVAAVTADSLNQVALTRLVELDLEQLDTLSLVTNTERLLVMRKPEPAFLRKIQYTLQSDRYIFEGSGALIQKISERLAQSEEG
jgi:tetratricopeptide (TPR) repeat protein